MRLRLLLLSFLPVFFFACGSSKKAQDLGITLDEMTVKPPGEYRPSATMVNDLLHTVLHVQFDWQKQWLNGAATLTLKPYAKPVAELELDAKGFDILKVGKLDGKNFTELPFRYDSLHLAIDLKEIYTEKDTYTIQVEYIAKPNDLPQGGSEAISSDKGLYFINPLGVEKNKPMQIWTQGETEASSCWFPTIDKPNERTTQEIYITVPDTMVTLSNGLLANSMSNADGTRTDFWKMDKPHAPYLFMMAIGDFAVVRDIWHGKPVDYYVEKAFEPYAKNIFGNTPEMLDFYSKILGLEYPWQKYAQACVRDYVSGAMENTTATVHFENMQLTKRELIDTDYEDIIAHELIHQWFGDYVTCESWANLSLNEGFATYGEYLWIEHKYGIDMAERHRADMLQQYSSEAWMYKRPIIDFHYSDKEDMFDSHSYAKGGLVLHMLRKYLGDDIFFSAIKIYLLENALQAVEIHHLRLAFEKASGEDLNWFFSQWLLSPGHPKLSISYDYNAEKSIAIVAINQAQDESAFRLPMAMDIYLSDTMIRHHVTIEKKEQTFEFAVKSKPLLVNVDAEKYLISEMTENKSAREWMFQYEKVSGYMNKRQALTELASSQKDDTIAKQAFINALNDPFWALRKLAVEKIIRDEETELHLAKAASDDIMPQVRAAAISRLGDTGSEKYMNLYKQSLADSSLQVVANALDAIFELDKDTAMALARQFEDHHTGSIVSSIGGIYAEAGDSSKQDYFEQKAYSVTSWPRYTLLADYGGFLQNKNEGIIRKGVQTLEDIALHAGSEWDRFSATNAIHELKRSFSEKSNYEGMDDLKKKELEDFLDKTLENILAAEKDDDLQGRYENFR